LVSAEGPDAHRQNRSIWVNVFFHKPHQRRRVSGASKNDVQQKNERRMGVAAEAIATPASTYAKN